MVQRTSKKKVAKKRASKKISYQTKFDKANDLISSLTNENVRSYDDLKEEMVAIQKEMDIAKKLQRKTALKTVKKLCREFGFTASMLKDSLKKGRNKKS
jgi:hypothetical protein